MSNRLHHSNPAPKPPGAFAGNQPFERRLNERGFGGEPGKDLPVDQELIVD